MSRLCELAEPFVVATPAGTSTTDWLRVTPDECPRPDKPDPVAGAGVS